jgi:hypothetical protein
MKSPAQYLAKINNRHIDCNLVAAGNHLRPYHIEPHAVAERGKRRLMRLQFRPA